MIKFTHEYVKEQYEIFGYKLKSLYKNNHIKNLVECPEGHEYKVRYNDFQQGRRCPICYNKIRSGKRKPTYNQRKNLFEKFQYKLLTKEYKNNNTKLHVECPVGHQFEITYSNFQQGRRCPVCFGNKKLTHKFVKKQYEKYGYKLLSKYKNCITKNLIECPEGHQYKSIYNSFQQGIRCPICDIIARHSRSEKDCLNIVKQIIPNEIIIENDRTQIINPKTNWNLELDMWIPLLNKAVEFNGRYWHNNEYSKYKDNQKEIQCREKNIDLLVVNYQDWVDNREEQIEKLNRWLCYGN